MRYHQAQVTLEYTIIIGFLIALTLGILTAMSLRLSQVEKDTKQQDLTALQNLISDEVKRAQIVEDGYSRIFTLPKLRSGYNYSLTYDDDQLLTVKYRDLEAYTFINATGNICISSSQSSFNVRIKKDKDSITLESCPECRYSFSVCDTALTRGTCSKVNTVECCLSHCRCC